MKPRKWQDWLMGILILVALTTTILLAGSLLEVIQSKGLVPGIYATKDQEPAFPTADQKPTRATFFIRTGYGLQDLYLLELNDIGVSALTQLTHTPECENSPTLSPDGEHIAALQYKSCNVLLESHLVVVNADGAKLTQLTDEVPIGTFVWSPDGARLAFLIRNESSISASADLFVASMSDFTVTRLTKDSRINGWPHYLLFWSPDGQRIAFISHEEQKIHIVNANGSGEISLKAPEDGNPVYTEQIWSPNGEQLALMYSTNLYLIDLNSLETSSIDLSSSLGPDAKEISNFTWSSDGHRLALVHSEEIFVTETGSYTINDLSTIKLDGSGFDYIIIQDVFTPHARGGVGSVKWSQDGQKFIFLAPRPSIVNADGSGLRDLAPPPERTYDFSGSIGPASPHWSQDEKYIFFVFGPWIYRVEPDGSNLVKMATIALGGTVDCFSWAGDQFARC
jgi:Tol biopolymer transport system component